MIIYKIENKINNMIYIGQTIRTMEERIYQHKKRDSYISRSLRKYGFDNFDYDIIYNGVDIDDLNEKEIYYIKKYNCIAPNGYNLEIGGKNSQHNEISKKKLSIAHTGKSLTEEHKKAISEALIISNAERRKAVYEKECNECGVVKNLDLFVKDSSYKSGYRGKCLECINKQRRKYYNLNKEDINKKRTINKNKNK
jgi:group I intron endonuclease